MTGPGPSYTYRVVTTATPRRRFSSSRTELLNIGIAFAVLSVDLVLIFSNSTLAFGSAGFGLLQEISITTVVVAILAALTGFVGHELAHKVVAQWQGYWAEFRMSAMGLVLSFVTAYVGFLWGAPGATVVSGMNPERRGEWGRTILAGPMANVLFGGAFYIGAAVAYSQHSSFTLWLLLLAWINGWFGTFNLVPVGPLDGRKVLRWNAGIWVLAIAGTGALAVVSFLAAFIYGTPFFLR